MWIIWPGLRPMVWGQRASAWRVPKKYDLRWTVLDKLPFYLLPSFDQSEDKLKFQGVWGQTREINYFQANLRLIMLKIHCQLYLRFWISLKEASERYCWLKNYFIIDCMNPKCADFSSKKVTNSWQSIIGFLQSKIQNRAGQILLWKLLNYFQISANHRL